MLKIPEHLLHELLELTRLYVSIPYNAIFMFVTLEQCRTLDFYDDKIYNVMIGGWNSYGYKTEQLLREIRDELVGNTEDSV